MRVRELFTASGIACLAVVVLVGCRSEQQNRITNYEPGVDAVFGYRDDWEVGRSSQARLAEAGKFENIKPNGVHVLPS